MVKWTLHPDGRSGTAPWQRDIRVGARGIVPPLQTTTSAPPRCGYSRSCQEQSSLTPSPPKSHRTQFSMPWTRQTAGAPPVWLSPDYFCTSLSGPPKILGSPPSSPHPGDHRKPSKAVHAVSLQSSQAASLAWCWVEGISLRSAIFWILTWS